MKRIISLALAAALLMASASACGSNSEDKQVDLAAFSRTVQSDHAFPDMDRLDPEDGEFGAIMLDYYYPGLTDMDFAQFEVYMAKSSFSGVELALIQVKNPADAARVKELFQARIDDMTKPGNYSDAAELWEHHARVASNGRCVLLVAHEDGDAIVSEFNGLFQ